MKTSILAFALNLKSDKRIPRPAKLKQSFYADELPEFACNLPNDAETVLYHVLPPAD